MAGADTLTEFSDGTSIKTLDFTSASNRTVNVVLPNDVHVSSAGMDIQSLELAPGNGFPTDVKIDVGDDGTYDWGFQDIGSGDIGHQYELSTGASLATAVFQEPDGGTNTSNTILLPKSAMISDAWFELAGNGDVYHPVEGVLLKGASSGEYFGWAVKDVGDVNDDGWSDMVVGIKDGNRAELYHGGPSFDNIPDLVMDGLPGSDFGQCVAGLGDVNEDTVDDFAVAENGTVRIFFGGSGLDAVADLNLTGEPLGEHYFGVSLAGGSDLDDDGHPDIVVGDHYNNITYKGSVYVFNGGPALDNAWDHRFNGSVGMKFGEGVATGGDLDNDGHDDLVVATTTCFWDSLPGEIDIFKGGPTFGASPPISTIIGDRDEEHLGLSMALDGDVNGDDIDDLMVGGAYGGAGRTYLIWGRDTWPGNPPVSRTLYGENTDDLFGFSVAYTGDTNHDGMTEILVGAPYFESYRGKTYLINGSDSPSVPDATTFLGATSSAMMGWSVDGIGDINDDEDSDLAISSVFIDSGRGDVTVYYGSYGLENANVRFGGAAMEPLGMSILNGTKGTYIKADDLQNEIDGTGVAHTDIYGNELVELVVELGTTGPGTLILQNISINYTADMSSTMDLEDAINSYLTSARENGTPGEDALVPIVIESGSRGRLVLSDLAIVHTHNQVPVAVIDNVDPLTFEAGYNVTFEGHGTDDGSVVAYSWTSSISGVLGHEQTIDVALHRVGTHTISFQVQDDMGRWSLPDMIQVNVTPSNIEPLIWIDDPIEGQLVNGVVMISGNAADHNLEDQVVVEVRIDDGPWETASGITPWEYVWDTTNGSDGPHMISARAGDGRLYSKVMTVNVTVHHPMPGVSVTSRGDVESYPGDDVELVFTINNTGTETGRFQFLVRTTPVFKPYPDKHELTLAPGEEQVVKCIIDLSYLQPGSTVTVEFNASLEIDPSIWDMETVKITVVERPPNPDDQSVVLGPPADGKARPGKSVTYIFTIRNKGTVPDLYDITIVSSNSWDITATVDRKALLGSVEIDIGVTVELEVTVTVPKDARPGTIDELTVEVQSLNFPQVHVSSPSVETKVLSEPEPSRTIVVPVAPVMVTVVTVFVLGALLGGTEWGKYGFFWLLIPMYSRLKKEAVLDNFKRGEINAFIKLNPGTYYNEIKKHLGVSNGVLTYHLNRLEREGYIRSKVNGRYKHYFASDMKLPKKIILLNEIQRGLLTHIRDSHGVTQAHISAHFDLPLPTVSRHLRRLRDADMVSVEKRNNVNYYLTSYNVDGAEEDYNLYDEEAFTKTPPDNQ